MTPAQFHIIGKRLDADVRRHDLGFGIVASVVANVNRDPKKRKKPYQASDFMPTYEIKKKHTPQSLKGHWDSIIVPHLNARARAIEARKGAANAGE